MLTCQDDQASNAAMDLTEESSVICIPNTLHCTEPFPQRSNSHPADGSTTTNTPSTTPKRKRIDDYFLPKNLQSHPFITISTNSHSNTAIDTVNSVIAEPEAKRKTITEIEIDQEKAYTARQLEQENNMLKNKLLSQQSDLNSVIVQAEKKYSEVQTQAEKVCSPPCIS
jgi:hypothetical protein